MRDSFLASTPQVSEVAATLALQQPTKKKVPGDLGPQLLQLPTSATVTFKPTLWQYPLLLFVPLEDTTSLQDTIQAGSKECDLLFVLVWLPLDTASVLLACSFKGTIMDHITQQCPKSSLQQDNPLSRCAAAKQIQSNLEKHYGPVHGAQDSSPC